MVMALIYTMCERFDEAIAELDHLLSLESRYTVHDIELDLGFEPLRDHPAYRALLVKYALPALP